MSRLQGHHYRRVANLNRRFKFSHDPNNTAWSRSATKYGQKILQSHGWTPGKLLGASSAPYSDLRSAASASHIRITLKDDNLGLGAKHEAARDSSETTGLHVFQDLLGRLNGRSTTDLQKDRIHRSKLRSSAYIDQRWGNLHFISGGLLVGAELRDLVKGDQDALNESQQTSSHYLENRMLPEANRPQEEGLKTSKRKKYKKRKVSGDDYRETETSKGAALNLGGAQSPRNLLVETERKPEREPEREPHTLPKDMFDEAQMDKARRHAEKAERKRRRRAKRDARQSSRVQEQSPILPSPKTIHLRDPDIGEVAVASHPLREKNASTRVSEGLRVGRLAVRQR